jgi:single stranded DNA-binding protein
MPRLGQVTVYWHCKGAPTGNKTMQKVMLIGNLGRDPEVKYSQQGMAIAQFSIATTERWKDKSGELQEHTEWFAVQTLAVRLLNNPSEQ